MGATCDDGEVVSVLSSEAVSVSADSVERGCVFGVLLHLSSVYRLFAVKRGFSL